MLNSGFLGVVLKASLGYVAFIFVTQAQLTPGVNQQDGALLCRVYQIANRKIEESTPWPEVETYVEEIDLINISLAEEGWVQTVEAEAKAGNHNEVPGAEPGSELRKRWKKAIETIQKGVASKGGRVTLSPSVRRKASRKLKLIEEKVGTLLKSINAFAPDAELVNVNQLFQQAIYGEDANKGDEKKGWHGIANTRATQCGASNLRDKGALTGSSIGLDLHCLCVPQANNNLVNACGVNLGNPDTYNWAAGAIADSDGAMWGKIKQYCENYPKPNSTATARATLQEFLARLAAGGQTEVANVKRKHGLLGATAEDAATLGCDGNKGTEAGNGICVYYGADNWETKITWYRKITQALGKIETHEEGIKKLQENIAELKHLKTRAEEIYAEAKIDSESEQGEAEKTTQNQTPNQNLTSTPGKATAQETISVSASTHPRLILPWTFLI